MLNLAYFAITAVATCVPTEDLVYPCIAGVFNFKVVEGYIVWAFFCHI